MSIVASTVIKTEFGDFKVCYHESKNGFCVSFSQGDLSEDTPVVRLHSACLFGEAFHSLHCDCSHQLRETMQLIKNNGHGVIVYSYQEGRGIGLEKKIEAMEVQRTEKCDNVEAFKKLGLEKVDYRGYKAEIEALKDLKISKNVKTFSGNPKKIMALKKAGYNIKELLRIDSSNLSDLAKEERLTKKNKMNYFY